MEEYKVLFKFKLADFTDGEILRQIQADYEHNNLQRIGLSDGLLTIGGIYYFFGRKSKQIVFENTDLKQMQVVQSKNIDSVSL